MPKIELCLIRVKVFFGPKQSRVKAKQIDDARRALFITASTIIVVCLLVSALLLGRY